MRAVATTAGATIESPWFTAAEAAAYLRIVSADGSLHAFYIAYPRMGIPAYRFTGSRGIRFHQDDLDAALGRARRAPDSSADRDLESGLTKSPRSNPDSVAWASSEHARSPRRPRLVGHAPRRNHARA